MSFDQYGLSQEKCIGLGFSLGPYWDLKLQENCVNNLRHIVVAF